jgi:signal transduction histidine kinase
MTQKGIKQINSTKEHLIIKSDRNRIEQVLNNLILNAVDFVPYEKGEIEYGAQSKDDEVLFYVKDNGIGIPAEKQKNLFNKFYQIDTSLTRKHGGSGLGLAISKGIISGLGGKIWVESELGRGAAFYFTIPKEPKEIDAETTDAKKLEEAIK